MRITIDDLEKALNWIKKNSNETQVNVESLPHVGHVVLKTFDKYNSEVTIQLPEGGKVFPKITKTENL
jgi:molecular chaperone GrpE (heat shock protein)